MNLCFKNMKIMKGPQFLSMAVKKNNFVMESILRYKYFIFIKEKKTHA